MQTTTTTLEAGTVEIGIVEGTIEYWAFDPQHLNWSAEKGLTRGEAIQKFTAKNPGTYADKEIKVVEWAGFPMELCGKY